MMNTIQHRITWGSHVPLHKAILKTFDVTGVLELGAGHNSTPMFFQHTKKVISIETDKKWIDEMRMFLNVDDKHQLIHMKIPEGIIRSTRRSSVSPQFLYSSVEFVRSKIEPELNMMFIDCISSLRYEMLIRLYHKFDIITFHDYQRSTRGNGIKNHYNNEDFIAPEGYSLFVDETYPAYTGLLVKNDLLNRMDDLRRAHAVEVKGYYDGHAAQIVSK